MGQASTPLLGRMFHESFARLFSDDEYLNFYNVIQRSDRNQEAWRRQLEDHLYRKIIGPRLSAERVHLINKTEQVLGFWDAAKEMNRWLSGLLWAARDRTGKTPSVNLLISAEEPLRLIIKEDDWTDSVLLTGMADLVLRIPGQSYWCVVELKLGKVNPEANLGQACLYYQILSSRKTICPSGENGENRFPETADGGVLALVEFTPVKREHFYEAKQLRKAGKTLNRLIGRLAGVLPGQKKPNEEKSMTKKVVRTSTSPTENKKYLEQSRLLVSTFKEYGKEIFPEGEPLVGPTYIRYPVRLGKGVKISAAQKVASEVQHRLRLCAPPFVHISEGSVVIDLQREDRQNVYMVDLIHQFPKTDAISGSAKVVLGVDMDNRLRFADPDQPENVHILAAGTTGSGKSEWLRSVLAGLIFSNTPETLRLVLIDPKRNAFSELKASPFLLSPDALVFPDEVPADGVLARLADEMDKRYQILYEHRVDTRNDLVQKKRIRMPRIFCVCDEYFDLINRGKEQRKAVEDQIFRLGAKARAAGIHLIIATQQPSRQTVKGALDANIPARVALKMSKGIESSMLINCKGAENLLGKGDLLFKDIGDPIRLQAPLLTSEDRNKFFLSG